MTRRDARTSSRLLSLPPELLLHLLSFLPLDDLSTLTQICSTLHHHITTTTFRSHALAHSYNPGTLAAQHADWSWCRRAYWAERVKQRWETWSCRGSLVQRWDTNKGITVLSMWGARIITGHGGSLTVWNVSQRGQLARLAEWPPAAPTGQRRRFTNTADDITGVTPVDDVEIVVSTVGGSLKRLALKVRPDWRYELVEVARYTNHQATRSRSSLPAAIQAVSVAGNSLYSISTTRSRLPLTASTVKDLHSLPPAKQHHSLSLHSLNSPWTSSETISLPTKPWCLLAPPSSSFIAIGSSSTAPLLIHLLTPTGTLSTASCTSYSLTSSDRPTSIYALASPSLSSPFSPVHTLLTASYDSHTRLVDLRLRHASGSAVVLDLWDEKNDDPCYSLGMGGPGGCYVATGLARNSAFRLQDVRFPPSSSSSFSSSSLALLPSACFLSERETRGGMVFAPGREKSPVYGIQVEYSGVWGVGEKGFWRVGWGDGDRRQGEGVGWVELGDQAGRLRNTAVVEDALY